MPDVVGARISVGTTAEPLFPGLDGRWHIRIENLDASNAIHVGDANVTAPAGGQPGAELSGGAVGVRGVFQPTGPVANPENIYAICAAGQSATVSALAIRAAD